MTKLTVPAIFLWLALLPVVSFSAEITGSVHVVDGDTLNMIGESTSHRLNGIDSPEIDQLCIKEPDSIIACGEMSRAVLVALVDGQPVTCRQQSIDSYGRWISHCVSGDTDLNAEMVRSGMSFAYRKYEATYAAIEDYARSNQKGLWNYTFIFPWIYRSEKRAKMIEGMEPAAGQVCRIKGNISSYGKRIYHVPGSKHYGITRINEALGEQWFCTELEAQSMGWVEAQ